MPILTKAIVEFLMMSGLSAYEIFPGMFQAIFKGFGSLIAGAIGAYLAIRFKNLATRADAEYMREELETNTRTTREIEQKLAQTDYLMKRELEFRERQLSVLYGPIYGYLQSQKQILDLWLRGKLSDRNLQVKKFLTTQDAEIRSLILNNIHLIDDATMQDYIVNFFTSSIIFEWYAASSADGEVPKHLSEDEKISYPSAFDDHFTQTTERLKARVQSLHHEFSMPLNQVR